MHSDALTTVAGFLIGAIVGATGVGGGALMTPVLVLLFGVAPRIAVGTDLLFACATKVFGVAVHQRHGTVDWPIVARLAMGSLPAAGLTLAWMRWSGGQRLGEGAVLRTIGAALLLTAIGMILKTKLPGRQALRTAEEGIGPLRSLATILAGAALGVLVTMTSIGAGALGTVLLVSMYPRRMEPSRLVGTDLAHALLLALVAGLGHLQFGHTDFHLLGSLLLGSIPGVLLGTLVSTRAPQTFLRRGIALTLGAVAIRMLI